MRKKKLFFYSSICISVPGFLIIIFLYFKLKFSKLLYYFQLIIAVIFVYLRNHGQNIKKIMTILHCDYFLIRKLSSRSEDSVGTISSKDSVSLIG